ncbi:MAG: DUF4846 domain-containing protein [Prevotella sp.]|nr:DUF4846 domain-containing protein [Prevotella sp.]
MRQSILTFAILTTLAAFGCQESGRKASQPTVQSQQSVSSQVPQARFTLPKGYTRVTLPPGTFGAFLRRLPLKPAGSDLHYYNGSIKQRNYDGAVMDVDFGHAAAEQCADAIIYLRALWLWQTRQYDKIHFNFTNGFRADYSRWAKGDRIHVNQRTWRCWYSRDAKEDYSYRTFRKYLTIVFTYAGTASLEKELMPITGKELQVGDVIINGGHPGHTVIIVDKASDKAGHAVYLLAQGYTPAQEIEIFNTWFVINPQVKYLETPGWTFRGNYARRFR